MMKVLFLSKLIHQSLYLKRVKLLCRKLPLEIFILKIQLFIQNNKVIFKYFL